jgi:hypothetical protein
MGPSRNRSLWSWKRYVNIIKCVLLSLIRFFYHLVRTTDLFYKLFLINVTDRKARQICPFVKSGLMHRAFHKYLRLDGLGIDYSNLETYDTKSVLEAFLESQHPYWIGMLKSGMEKKNKGILEEAINNSVRIGLDKKKPELVQQAREVLESIRN